MSKGPIGKKKKSCNPPYSKHESAENQISETRPYYLDTFLKPPAKPRLQKGQTKTTALSLSATIKQNPSPKHLDWGTIDLSLLFIYIYR